MAEPVDLSDALDPDESGSGPRRRLIIALVVALLALVIGAAAVAWFRRGGAKQLARKVAEAEAVRLADKVVDQIFPDAEAA